MDLPKMVSAQEYELVRERFLVVEKAATHALDALAAERRRLPMVSFSPGYVFAGSTGEVTLLDLFDGRRQLIVYQFMDLGPDAYCAGCTSFTDNTDVPAGRAYLRAHDTAYATVSDMPLTQIEAYKKERGWSVPFYSSRGTTFSSDTGAGGGFLLSVFLRDGNAVARTYYTRGRGVDRLKFDANMFDLTPLGRQQDWEEPPNADPHTQARFAVLSVT
jgi:predicted dithiol-disulfide oxidoreductase (DUF899 family)